MPPDQKVVGVRRPARGLRTVEGFQRIQNLRQRGQLDVPLIAASCSTNSALRAGRLADAHQAACGTSRTPSARMALTIVSKLGFPSFESALCSPARVMPVSLASFVMPP